MSAAARTGATVTCGHRCSGCGARYVETEWVVLEVKERIAPREVRRLVREWPDEVCIEVRRCSRCGHAIAAKRPVASMEKERAGRTA